jgi:hypothetical protein
MEKFKACEKEMKTKAFSKEGLIQAAKLDPKEQEKEEATQWLQSQVEELQMQVESAEAEVESLQGGGKRRNKQGTNTGRLEELEHLNERRKWHISRLEIILRLLNNGSLSPEKVQDLKEDVQYFLESNAVRALSYFCTYFRSVPLCFRKRTLKKMKGFTTNLILKKRKKSLALSWRRMTAVVQMEQAKVSRSLLMPSTHADKHQKNPQDRRIRSMMRRVSRVVNVTIARFSRRPMLRYNCGVCILIVFLTHILTIFFRTLRR